MWLRGRVLGKLEAWVSSLAQHKTMKAKQPKKRFLEIK